MDKKTKGAWILHHQQKLLATTNQDFDAIGFAGKCGTLLSAICAERQVQISGARLDALAKANQISPKAEAPAILAELERQRLIQTGAGAVEVLGLTGQAVLEHTAIVFEETTRESHEDAVLEVSEMTSELPASDSHAVEYISDIYKLPVAQASNTILLGGEIGFFDSESVSQNERLLFNGNLFRKDDARKVASVINSLSQDDQNHFTEINQRLQAAGCLPLDSVKQTLGDKLFSKLHSIGMIDVSVVGNNSGKNYFVTRPAAFSKFTNSIADDALDLAKAFVASLTYGMTISSYSRGRIQMIEKLMKRLIAGGSVGPATAIGNDYQVLELKGVVRVTPSQRGMFTMKLLKPEVGKLALAVIKGGDITAESIPHLPGACVTDYRNPERTREVERRKSSESIRISTRNLLTEIRTGGLSR